MTKSLRAAAAILAATLAATLLVASPASASPASSAPRSARSGNVCDTMKNAAQKAFTKSGGAKNYKRFADLATIDVMRFRDPSSSAQVKRNAEASYNAHAQEAKRYAAAYNAANWSIQKRPFGCTPMKALSIMPLRGK